MATDILAGLAVSFGYVLGPLLGSWTTDEGIKLKKLGFIELLRRSKYILPGVYALLLWACWLLNLKELGAIGIFALILIQTSLVTKHKLDRTSLRQGVVFLVLFSVLTWFV